MDDLSRHRARGLLAELARELEGGEETAPLPLPGSPIDGVGRRLATAKAWQRASAVRRRIFEEGESLFSDPGWDILLDLYIEDAEHRSVSVSSACIAAGVPPTTGLRWLDRLQRRGLLTRTPDPQDGRKIYIGLTVLAATRIGASLDAAGEGDRKLGLGRLTLLS
jgi:DNA-binding MarR family transcriptional regulator